MWTGSCGASEPTLAGVQNPTAQDLTAPEWCLLRRLPTERTGARGPTQSTSPGGLPMALSTHTSVNTAQDAHKRTVRNSKKQGRSRRRRGPAGSGLTREWVHPMGVVDQAKVGCGRSVRHEQNRRRKAAAPGQPWQSKTRHPLPEAGTEGSTGLQTLPWTDGWHTAAEGPQQTQRPESRPTKSQPTKSQKGWPVVQRD